MTDTTAPTDTVPDPCPSITLGLLNRDEVITFLNSCGWDIASEPDDLGSDVVIVDMPGHRNVVILGETVTAHPDHFTVGRGTRVRTTFPRPAAPDQEGTTP